MPDHERTLLLQLAQAWNHGWQPRELVRQVRRTCAAPELGLALRALAADHHGRDASTIDRAR